MVFAIVLLVSVGSGFAGSGPEKLTFPLHRFLIAPLEAPAGQGNQAVMAMYLAPSQGFAANINVMVQPWPGTIKNYLAVSEKQFADMGLKVVNKSLPDDHTAVFEYEGIIKAVSPSTMHWYVRAISRSGKVYLATATATSAQWKTDGSKLKACVDSFELATP